MHHRLRPGHLLLTAGLALLLGACSASSAPAATQAPAGASTPAAATAAATQVNAAPPTAGTASGKACTIFTFDAVATAVGFAINATSGTDSICFYQNADVSKYLAVTLYDSQAGMAQMLQIETGSEHIAGLGDDAFWVSFAGILFVRVGDHGIELIDAEAVFDTSGSTSVRDALVTLVKSGLAKL